MLKPERCVAVVTSPLCCDVTAVVLCLQDIAISLWGAAKAGVPLAQVNGFVTALAANAITRIGLENFTSHQLKIMGWALKYYLVSDGFC